MAGAKPGTPSAIEHVLDAAAVIIQGWVSACAL